MAFLRHSSGLRSNTRQENPHKNVGQGFCKNNFPTFLFNGRN